MAIHDNASQRLFVSEPLAQGLTVTCLADQAHYLTVVMRASPGSFVLIFNGRDGEWRAQISEVKKRSCALLVGEQVRPQANGPDIDYLFAPLKHARLDYMVQKATEMGVRRLRPVMTRRTVPDRVNLERMRANAVEAAEQCGILCVPDVAEPEKLSRVLDSWDVSRRLVFCDESAAVTNPVDVLAALPPGPLALLIGPEGGFGDEEREMILQHNFSVAISLGPRVMRADTAAVAALAIINATVGDWRT